MSVRLSIDAATRTLTGTRTTFEEGINQLGKIVNSAISNLRDYATGLRIIYERLGTLPVLQIEKDVLRRQITDLEELMAPFWDGTLWIVVSTLPRPGMKLEQLIDFDATVTDYYFLYQRLHALTSQVFLTESSLRRKGQLETYMWLRTSRNISVRRKAQAEPISVNGMSLDEYSNYFEEAIVGFPDIFRRAQTIFTELEYAIKLLNPAIKLLNLVTS